MFENLLRAADYNDNSIYCVQSTQYMTDLGGVFGLWFGFAVMAVAELLELFTDVILLGIWRLIDAIC